MFVVFQNKVSILAHFIEHPIETLTRTKIKTLVFCLNFIGLYALKTYKLFS